MIDVIWRVLGRARFWGVFVAPSVVFWVLTSFVPNPIEIMILNLALAGLSVAVVIAYGHYLVTKIVSVEPMDTGDLIAVGIFYSFGSYAFRAIFSLTWRWLGQPAWLVNSDLANFLVFLPIMAAVLHLAARGAIKGQVPTSHWVRIGLYAGIAVIAGLLLIHWSDIADEVHRYWSPNDTGATPSSFIRPL